MKLTTWNVDSIRARLDRVMAWVDVHQPDVLCLQETKVANAKFPRAAFAERDYELLLADSTGHAGLAVASRVGLTDPQVGFPGAVGPLAQPRSISATCGDVRVHTAYAPNGRKVGTHHHDIKLAWFQLLGAWMDIDNEADQPTVLIGDLNIAPLDVDVWEPSRYRKRNLTSPRERAAFNALLDGRLVDVVREAFGDEHVFTWWNRRSDFYESDRGWRLDHALTDPATATRVTRVEVDRHERGQPGASDHAPLTIELDR